MDQYCYEASSLPLTARICSIDILPKIFRFLTSPKDIVRLECVCRSFQQIAQIPESWSGIKHLVIEDETIHLLINDEHIQRDQASAAIESIFVRNRNVMKVTALNSVRTNVLSLIVDIIPRQGVLSYRHLQALRINCCGLLEFTQPTAALINALKNQLKYLEIRALQFNSSTDASQFWSIVGECTKLEGIDFFPVSDHVTTHDMVITALRGKAIQSIGFIGSNVSADHLVTLIRVFANYSLLTQVSCGKWEIFSLADFVQRLPSAHMNNLQDFRFLLTHPVQPSDPTWSTLLCLPRLCPQLKSLSLGISLYWFKPVMIVELVVAYLAIQNESDAVSSGGIDLMVLHKLNDHEIAFIRDSLVNDHKCKLMIKEQFSKELYHSQLGKGSVRLFFDRSYILRSHPLLCLY